MLEKRSEDGTHKWLLGIDGGNADRNRVHPRAHARHAVRVLADRLRPELPFCSTGTQGFNRNLSTAEIIGQVWVAAKHLGNVPHRQRKLTNVVMMGMGEPLLNFDNVVRAMSVMRDDFGFGLANKRVTLSTAGLVPMIDRLSERPMYRWRCRCMRPTTNCARELVPLNKKYPIAELLDACARYAQRRPRTTITFEYTMMKGVNDHPEHARQLVKLMRKLPSKVNLIPFNTFTGTQYRALRRIHRDFQRPAGGRRADHGAAHAWRRYRCGLRPAEGPGHGPNRAPGGIPAAFAGVKPCGVAVFSQVPSCCWS